MLTEYIEIRGARENNLRDVSLRIPKRKITIFTGVSGSGKSSIVFDTIASEAQRLLNENFSMFIRNFLPRYAQPDADAIENLSMAVVVDQKRMGGARTPPLAQSQTSIRCCACCSRAWGNPMWGIPTCFRLMTRKACVLNVMGWGAN